MAVPIIRIGLFQKKSESWGCQCKIPEGRVKVVEIQGGIPKLEEKMWISRGVITKDRFLAEGHGKIDC